MEEIKSEIISKSGFLLYVDYWDKYFSKMTGEQFKETMKIIFHFNSTFEVLSTKDLAIDMVVATIIDNLKRDAAKRIKQSIASRNNGKLGGRPKNSMGYLEHQKNPTLLPNNNDNLNLKSKSKMETKENILADFEEFWKDYIPVKVKDGKFVSKGSRKAALTSYQKLRLKHDKSVIYNGAAKYLVDCYLNNRLSCQAVVFLNQERFLDDYGSQETLEVKK